MKTFMAIYTASPDNMKERPDEATIEKGMAAWGQWMKDNHEAIVDPGGPLGKTKKAGPDGVSDIKNALTGYIVVEAADHAAAAALFKDHPHFTVFPGDGVEVMEIMPMPGT
jgi:hypothetical protein